MNTDEKNKLIADFEELIGFKTKIEKTNANDAMDSSVTLTVEMEVTSGISRSMGISDTVLAETDKNSHAISILRSKGFYPNNREVADTGSFYGDENPTYYNVTTGYSKTYESPEKLTEDLERITSYSKGPFSGVGIA